VITLWLSLVLLVTLLISVVTIAAVVSLVLSSVFSVIFVTEDASVEIEELLVVSTKAVVEFNVTSNSVFTDEIGCPSVAFGETDCTDVVDKVDTGAVVDGVCTDDDDDEDDVADVIAAASVTGFVTLLLSDVGGLLVTVVETSWHLTGGEPMRRTSRM